MPNTYGYPGNYYNPTQLPQVKTGTTWDLNASNPFGMNFRRSSPTMGVSNTPAPVPSVTAGGGLIGTGNTLQTGSTYTAPQSNNVPMTAGGGLVGAGNMPTPAAQPSYTPPQPTMGQPNYGPGYTPGAFNTQYGTLDNIQQYMNPYLDQIIERGNKNILASASARGLLGSTGTANQLGDWAAGAQADAFNDAFGRFSQDRGYMTDTYFGNEDRNYRNYRDTNAWNYGLFTDERQDYNQRMRDWYDQMNSITGTGINATNSSADVWGDYFRALAGLYGNQGDVGAMQAMQQGNNNSGLISGLIGLLGL